MSRHGKTLKRLARHEQKGSTRCCLCCFFFLPSTVTQTLAALLLLLRPLKREILAAGKKGCRYCSNCRPVCVHSPVCPRLACNVLNVRSGEEQHGVQTTATQRHQQQPAGSADISTSCVRRKPLDERDDVIVN